MEKSEIKQIVISRTKMSSILSIDKAKYGKSWCFVIYLDLPYARIDLEEACKLFDFIKYLCYATEIIEGKEFLVGYLEVKNKLKKESIKKKIKCLRDVIIMREKMAGKGWSKAGEAWVYGGQLPDGSIKGLNYGFWQSKIKVETRGRPRFEIFSSSGPSEKDFGVLTPLELKIVNENKKIIYLGCQEDEVLV